jgi:hypothetical protein
MQIFAVVAAAAFLDADAGDVRERIAAGSPG